jgi:hypothetical protein
MFYAHFVSKTNKIHFILLHIATTKISPVSF